MTYEAWSADPTKKFPGATKTFNATIAHIRQEHVKSYQKGEPKEYYNITNFIKENKSQKNTKKKEENKKEEDNRDHARINNTLKEIIKKTAENPDSYRFRKDIPTNECGLSIAKNFQNVSMTGLSEEEGLGGKGNKQGFQYAVVCFDISQIKKQKQSKIWDYAILKTSYPNENE